MTDEVALTRVLTDFARLLFSDYHVSDALHDLVDGVTEVLNISGAGVSLAEGDRLEFATAANEPVSRLERVQEDAQEGPCLDAHRSGQTVLVADLADDPARWPALSRSASHIGSLAVAGLPMSLNGTSLGALNLYDFKRHDWSEEEVGAARLLADVATGYVANASRLAEVRRTTEQLQKALDSRVLIEQAKGVLAGERHISVDESFKLLRAHARSHNLSLRSVAEAVVNLRLRL
ncbi:MAG TPA: GAF and ANTAR domain-containing protein [Acidimicrobiales bacterium]|nr:GAF and ANTAR domain-containing protein [Acidimicrobiales bacterium]